jgi:hypothetical protein
MNRPMTGNSWESAFALLQRDKCGGKRSVTPLSTAWRLPMNLLAVESGVNAALRSVPVSGTATSAAG